MTTTTIWTHTLDTNTGSLAIYRDGVIWGRIVGAASTRIITRREAAAWLFGMAKGILDDGGECTSILHMMSKASADLAANNSSL